MDEWQILEHQIDIRRKQLEGTRRAYESKKKLLEEEREKLKPLIDEVAQLSIHLGTGYAELRDLEEKQLHVRGGPNDR